MTTTEPAVWHPWRTLREQYPHVLVIWTELPEGRWAETDGSTIWIDPRLSQVQRRCVLTHELWHIRRGVIPADAAEEQVCDELAARELIPLGQLAAALRWSRDPAVVAAHLWVDAYTLRVRLDTLRQAEAAELKATLSGAWWQA